MTKVVSKPGLLWQLHGIPNVGIQCTFTIIQYCIIYIIWRLALLFIPRPEHSRPRPRPKAQGQGQRIPRPRPINWALRPRPRPRINIPEWSASVRICEFSGASRPHQSAISRFLADLHSQLRPPPTHLWSRSPIWMGNSGGQGRPL